MRKGHSFVRNGGLEPETTRKPAGQVRERPSGGWGDILVEEAVAEGPSDAELAQAARTYGEGV